MIFNSELYTLLKEYVSDFIFIPDFLFSNQYLQRKGPLNFNFIYSHQYREP